MDNGSKLYFEYLNGSDSALIKIIELYRDPLILYLNGIVRNLDVAEELAEDTFVKLALKKPIFYRKSAFKSWLYRIGHNLAVDYIRKGSHFQTAELEVNTADTFNLENEFLKSEDKRALFSALKRLPQNYCEVLYLVYFEDFKVKTVAKILKKSPHATETLLYRARKSLKEILETEDFYYENL